MGVSGEDPSKGIDASVGALVWVRRRNGSWWPGKILGPDELPEGSVTSLRSGTPVKLLGRDDASVDWYNLEKSKRVKAFHCGEYDDCIEKVKASASQLSKKGVKYARREDAILHALELESARFVKDHPNSSAIPDTQYDEHHHVDEFHSSEESEDVDEDSSSSGDDSDLAHEVSQSGVSFEEPDHVEPAKEEEWRNPNDSEGDGVGAKRMRGLKDLGMGVASLLKRKRSQVAHVHELLKRKNRRRTLTKVLECTTMMPVPAGSGQLSSPTGSSAPVASDDRVLRLESDGSKRNNNGVLSENGATCNASMHANDAFLKRERDDNEIKLAVPDSGLVQRLFAVNLVAEEKRLTGLSSIVSDASQQIRVGAGAQSSQSSHVETISLRNEEHNESGSASSGTANVNLIGQRMEKGTTVWRSKGKRNSRSRRVDIDDEAERYAAGADRETFLARPSRSVDLDPLSRPLVSDGRGHHVKTRPITEIQVEEFHGWSWNAPQKAELLAPQRLLPYRQSRFTVNPKYDSSDFSLRHHIAASGLFDVTVQVKSGYQPQRVPYISLMSKINGRPIIGHPLTIEVLDDSSCDNLFNFSECYSSSSEFDYKLTKDISILDHVGTTHKRRPRGRPPNKPRSSHAPSSQSKPKRNGLLSKKTRKLSSLTSSHRLSRGQMKPAVKKLKGPSIACVPLNVVFSRINAALNSSVRPPPRPVATSGA